MTIQSSNSPMNYLQNSELFAEFRSCCRKKIFENQVSKEDLQIAQSIILVSLKDPDFEQAVSAQVAKFGEEKIKVLIARVMGLADYIPKPAPASAFPPRRFTVHPSISVLWPKPTPSSSQTVLPPRRTTVDAGAGLFSPKGNSTKDLSSHPLSPGSPKEIGSADLFSPRCRLDVRSPPPIPPNPYSSKREAAPLSPGGDKRERVAPPLPARPKTADFSRKPVLTQDSTLDPDVCSVIEKIVRIVSDDESSPLSGGNEAFPNLAEIFLLRSGGKSLPMKIEETGASGKDRKPQTTRTLSATHPQGKGDPMALLTDRSWMEKIMEGAVCIRYIFPESFARLFPNKDEQEVVRKLILLDSIRKMVGGGIKKLIEALFSVKKKGELDLIDLVLTKILKDQTISKISAASSFPHDRNLPEVFLQAPFDSRKNLQAFLEVATFVVVHCSARYTEYPENEKRILYFIMDAFTLSEMFPVDFSAALNRVLSVQGAVRESDVESLILRVNMGLKPRLEEPKEQTGQFDAQKAIAEILSSRHFKDLAAFKALIAKIKEAGPSTTDFYGKKLCRLLQMILNRITNEPISLDVALRNSLTVKGLRRLYISESDQENMHQTLRVLNAL